MKVSVALTKSQLIEVEALKMFWGCKTRPELFRNLLEKELAERSNNSTFMYYLEDLRKEVADDSEV